MVRIDKLESALRTLKTGFVLLEKHQNSDISDMLEDSCVKRFEYTLETTIKLMKRILKQIYFIDEKELTVNNIFRLMDGYGFITSWENWRKYYQHRNNTAHEYNLNKSKDVISMITPFINDIDILISNLSKLKQND